MGTKENAFIARVGLDLENSSGDILDEGGEMPTIPARKACMWVAVEIAPFVSTAPKLLYAAFVEEAGIVSLVLQSLQTNRRLNYRFAADGGISTLRIDESLTCYGDVRGHDSNAVVWLAKWVVGREVE